MLKEDPTINRVVSLDKRILLPRIQSGWCVDGKRLIIPLAGR